MTHVGHNQLDDTLPLKIIYTNIVLVFVVAQTLRVFKTVLFLFFFSRSIQCNWLLLIIFFLSLLVLSYCNGREVEDYIKCELIDGRSSRHLNSFFQLLLLAVNYTHQYMLCMYCCYCWLYPYKVSYSFLRGLGNFAQEITKADILIEDQLLLPLDMATVDQEREMHKPNS